MNPATEKEKGDGKGKRYSTMTIVMTGFRDTELQNELKTLGAKLGTSVSKSTFVVLVKDLEEDTGKAEDAKKLGIPLMTPAAFKAKYL
jgi:NAD-dependent DNA ligase